MLSQVAGTHAAVKTGLHRKSETTLLNLPSGDDGLPHFLARQAAGGSGQFLERHGRHLDLQVDPIDQRTADLTHISFDLRRRAVAITARVVAIAARTGVHGRYENEIGRKGRRVQGPADRHLVVFQRLPHHLQRAAIKLEQLVEKQHAFRPIVRLIGGGRRFGGLVHNPFFRGIIFPDFLGGRTLCG